MTTEEREKRCHCKQCFTEISHEEYCEFGGRCEDCYDRRELFLEELGIDY